MLTKRKNINSYSTKKYYMLLIFYTFFTVYKVDF